MMKDCYTLEFADDAKFPECAGCPLSEECTGTVTLRGAKGAFAFGQALGLLAGLLLALFAAFRFPEAPHSSGWILGISLLYLVAVLRAAKEYAAENAEKQEALLKKAEAR